MGNEMTKDIVMKHVGESMAGNLQCFKNYLCCERILIAGEKDFEKWWFQMISYLFLIYHDDSNHQNNQV